MVRTYLALKRFFFKINALLVLLKDLLKQLYVQLYVIFDVMSETRYSFQSSDLRGLTKTNNLMFFFLFK